MFFFSSRRRHTRYWRDWSSDVCSSDLLSDIILKSFIARRTWGMRAGFGLRIIGSRHSSDATRLREFAARNRLLHVWIELEEDPGGAEALLERFGAKPSETPVVIWQGEEIGRASCRER